MGVGLIEDVGVDVVVGVVVVEGLTLGENAPVYAKKPIAEVHIIMTANAMATILFFIHYFLDVID